MDDAALLIAALTGRTVTPELIDAVHRHDVMLRSLLEEVRNTVPGLVPQPSGTWRSAAADHYVDGLSELRMRLTGARDGMDEAERSLTGRIRTMQTLLDAQPAASPAR
jgi:hypothetical protein